MPGAIKLSSNENPHGASPLALQALRECMNEVNIYPSTTSDELRQGIAKLRGLDTQQVICGSGSNEIFTLCAAGLIEEGTNAIGSQYTFSQYQYATELFGGQFRAQPARDFSYDVEAIVAAIDQKTRLVFLCSPNNPTGKIIPEDQLRWALNNIPPQVLVVLDQAYGEYADNSSFIDGAQLIAEYPHLLVTGTFSKVYGLAALRVGYGLAAAGIIRQLFRMKPPFNVNGLAQRAALAALSDSTFVKKSVETNAASKALLYQGLTELQLEFLRSEANYICIKNPRDSDLLVFLHNHGITIRSLKSFGLPEYVRITIPNREITQKILDLLKQWNMVSVE